MSSPSSELNFEVRNTVLRAGAGAGKTTTLVAVFLDFAKKFLDKQGRLPRIVVTTFTRKATQELKERLLKKALQEEREDLFHFISAKSSVQISTIHGVLNLFLSRYGSAIGLTPDYKIISENEVRKSARKIIRKVVLAKPHLQDLLEEYDFSTLENYLLKYFDAFQTHSNLAIASPEFFAEETKKFTVNIQSAARRVAQEILMSTDKEGWITYASSLQAVEWDQADSVQSFYDFAKKPSFLKKNPPFDESLHDQLELVREQVDILIENANLRPEYWEKHQKNATHLEELALEFNADFQRQKLEAGLLSMSDLETMAFKLIREFPDLAESFSLEWDFWMIDEYQDTSPTQVLLMKALVGTRPSFVVGDPQQSIYLFRGARSEVFFDKMYEVESSGGELMQKMVNYRSNPEVLKFINFYFTKLDSQFSAMEVDPQKEAYADSQNLQIIITNEVPEGEDYSEELASVARIQELLAEGVSPEQICLLSRTHKTLEETARLAQSFGVPVQIHSGSGFFERREVQDALNFLKFLVNPHDNYIFTALLRSPWFHLSDQQIVKICHDKKHSFWRESQNQKSALPEATSEVISLLKRYLSLSETLGLAWTLKMALQAQGYLDYSHKLDASGRREANLWKVVSLLNQEERRPGFNFLDFIEAGLESLSTDLGGNDADASPVIEPQRVNFMTVHAAKGLQFDHIILPALGKNADTRKDADLYVDEELGLWTIPVRDDDSQKMVQSLLAERIHAQMHERETNEFNRVLYVALTRAKKGISLLVGPKPGKRSWAFHTPLNLEEGVHEEDGFQYIVRKQNLHPVAYSEKSFALSSARSFWKDLGRDHSRPAGVVSVTDLISSHIDMGEGSSQKILPALKRAQQGTEAHKIFESLKYSEFSTVRANASPEMQKGLDYIANLKEAPVLEVINRGQVEWGFACQLPGLATGSILQGQIDLWGIVDRTLWILDYKTGSQRYAEMAFAQMETYAWALQKTQQLGDVDFIKLVVIYPMEQNTKARDLKITDLEVKIQNYFTSFSAHTPD